MNLALLLMFCTSGIGHAQVLPRKQVVPYVRPPMSALPTSATRQSTALAAAARTNAERPKELASFSVASADGKPMDVRSLAAKQHWLLLYRRPDCAACDKLMSGLAQGAAFQHGTGMTVLVAGASPADLGRVQAQFPQWTGATWAADPGSAALKALKMKGTPMLYGMNGTSVVFALAGMPGGAEQVSGAAAGWIAPTPSSAEGSTVGGNQ